MFHNEVIAPLNFESSQCPHSALIQLRNMHFLHRYGMQFAQLSFRHLIVNQAQTSPVPIGVQVFSQENFSEQSSRTEQTFLSFTLDFQRTIQPNMQIESAHKIYKTEAIQSNDFKCIIFTK